MRNLISRAWQSPSLMTYGSFFSKSLNLVVILPFVLTELSPSQIYLWYLFATIASLQILIDLGFGPTFSRVISYTLGGVNITNLHRPDGSADGIPNWEALLRVYRSMSYIYSVFSIAWCLILLVLGTLAVVRPISLVDNSTEAWLSWAIVIIASSVSIVGIKYSSFLQGVNEIAVLRRWEIFTSIFSTLSCVIILKTNGGLLGLVAGHQFWIVFSVIRNRYLSQQVAGGRIKNCKGAKRDQQVFDAIWPSAWRTGLGVLGGFGLIQMSGIIYAQISTPAVAAKYFLALRLIQLVSQFSQAPFYSRLPTLARIYSEGDKVTLVSIAKTGMLYSYISFVIGFIGLGVLGPSILKSIGSNVPFPESSLWVLFGCAFFVERYGAMHINLYSTTNHIINHIANCGTGIIYIIVAVALMPWSKTYAFPVALLLGNTFVYAWYAAQHSYREFGLSFRSFDASIVLPNSAAILGYIMLIWLV